LEPPFWKWLAKLVDDDNNCASAEEGGILGAAGVQQEVDEGGVGEARGLALAAAARAQQGLLAELQRRRPAADLLAAQWRAARDSPPLAAAPQPPPPHGPNAPPLAPNGASSPSRAVAVRRLLAEARRDVEAHLAKFARGLDNDGAAAHPRPRPPPAPLDDRSAAAADMACLEEAARSRRAEGLRHRSVLEGALLLCQGHLPAGVQPLKYATVRQRQRQRELGGEIFDS
jgi:hypothetical protein